MSRTDERLSITLPLDVKERLKAIADRNKRSMIAEATIAIQNYIEHEDSLQSESKAAGLNENQLRELVRGMLKDELSSIFTAGTVHGLSFAEPDGKKFEKATLKQRSC